MNADMNAEWYRTLDALQQNLAINDRALQELRQQNELNWQQIQASGQLITGLGERITANARMMGEIQQTQVDLSRLFHQQQAQFQELQIATQRLMERVEANQLDTNHRLETMKHQIVTLQQQLLALHQQIAALLQRPYASSR